MSGVLRRSCRWFLRYGGNYYCRRKAFENPRATMEKLDLGCTCDPDVDFQPVPWKKSDEDADEPIRKVMEWDDEP